MSDPARDGYQCHGPMIFVELPGVYDGTAAYLCEECGVWRHRFSPGDPRRAKVEAQMPAIVDAHLVGSRGSVE